MALVQKQLSDLVAISRSTGGGRFNAQGKYEWLSANQPRFDYDPITLSIRGILVEEQRTNLYTSSQSFSAGSGTTVIADSYVAPDGAMTADAVIENTANSEHFAQDRNIAMTAGATYTYSVFVKALGIGVQRHIYMRIASNGNTFGGFFSLTSKSFSMISGPIVSTGYQDLPNGYIRFWITFTAAATASSVVRLQLVRGADGAPAYSGDGVSGLIIWGGQFEAGLFPTSYIPTDVAQVTRAADSVSLNAIGPWFRSDEGTLLVSYSKRSVAQVSQVVASLNDGTSSNGIRLRSDDVSPASQVAEVLVGGVQQALLSFTKSAVAGAAYSDALAYKLNDIAGSENGGAVVVDGSALLPVVSSLNLGGGVSGNKINGWISRVRYFPRRLNNAELQAITA